MPDFDFLDFTPVPLQPRHDGWLPSVQFDFIVLLARGFSIEAAARSVGKSRTTAYALRKRPGAAGFAASWDSALAYARRRRMAQQAVASAPPPAPSRAEAAAVLDRLYPGWRGAAGEAVDAGEADRADEAERG